MKIDPFPGVLTQQTVSRPFTTKTGREGCQHVKAWVLTAEQEAWLRRWFPEEENSRLMKASGMSHSTLHRFARLLGLTKSEKGLHRIMKRQGQKTKRLCERNGYYDSLRGKAPGEACRQATAQMWQDIREGRREHPFAVMKREHPRKYRSLMQRKSEQRKATIRREHARMTYGLERKTRLRRVVMQKYTRSQTAHRHNALRRGYFVMEDCTEGSGERYNIYYDHDTHRSALFERNLTKDGFRVKEWEE